MHPAQSVGAAWMAANSTHCWFQGGGLDEQPCPAQAQRARWLLLQRLAELLVRSLCHDSQEAQDWIGARPDRSPRHLLQRMERLRDSLEHSRTIDER